MSTCNLLVVGYGDNPQLTTGLKAHKYDRYLVVYIYICIYVLIYYCTCVYIYIHVRVCIEILQGRRMSFRAFPYVVGIWVVLKLMVPFWVP